MSPLRSLLALALLASGDQAGTPLRISFGDTELTARLHDNATARDLAAQLPLTLTFRDHNDVERATLRTSAASCGSASSTATSTRSSASVTTSAPRSNAPNDGRAD
jgi:hypothetical protein